MVGKVSEWDVCPPTKDRFSRLVSARMTEMCVNSREPSAMVRIQRREIKKVEDFSSLGSTVQCNKECRKEVSKCVQAGRNGWRKVSAVMCDKRVSARVKEKMYKTMARAAIQFGLKTEAVGERQEAAEIKILSFSLEEIRMEKIRNEPIRETEYIRI